MGIEMNSSEIISNGGNKTDNAVITDQVALTLGTDIKMGPIVFFRKRPQGPALIKAKIRLGVPVLQEERKHTNY
jgi:hypothetical protein